MLRSYAFAARFVAQSRVLLVARDFGPGVEQLMAAEPWLLWVPNAIHANDVASWEAALPAIAALPCASVDRIIWLQDSGCTQLRDASQWVAEFSRVLDRNGTLMIRQPRPIKQPLDSEPGDEFWGLVDRLNAEFPWVDIAAEVNWSASSVTPVEEPAEGFAALEVDSQLANNDQAECEAYWCLCALRKEDTQNWKRPTLLLQPQEEKSVDSAQTFWAKRERVEQHFQDAAKLMTAQRRIVSLRSRLNELASQTQHWQQEEKPELLCRVVELQDRSMWLREQVVELERRSVQTIEAKTRLESQLTALREERDQQRKTIGELKARLEVLQHLARATDPLQRHKPARASLAAEVPAVACEAHTLSRTPEPEALPLEIVQALPMCLASVSPDDDRVLALPQGERAPQVSVESWIERVKELRSTLGAHAPEFVTRSGQDRSTLPQRELEEPSVEPMNPRQNRR